MTTLTESDIKELKMLVQAQTEPLKMIQKELTDVKISNAKIEATLGSQQQFMQIMQKMPDLTEKIGELKNWKQIGLVFMTAVISSIFSGTIGGVIGWLVRSGKV